jgi:hypothetical protein
MKKVLTVVLIYAAIARTQPATTQSTFSDIETLFGQLASDNWKQRQHAQEALVMLGADVRPRLQQLIREGASEEVRARAEAALQQIAENEECGMSPVTLKLSDAEPREVFAQLSKQAHAELEPAQPQFWEQAHLNKLTLSIDHQPFWTAMKEVCEKSGLEYAQWGDGLRLVQNGGGGQIHGPFVVSGAFLIVANRVNRSESIDLSGVRGPIKSPADSPPPDRDFSVQLTAFPEPKLHILQAWGGAKLDVAIDEKGTSLLPATTPDYANQGYMMGINGTWTFTARLNYPGAQLGKVLRKLKGSVGVVLQTKFETIDIANITTAKNVEKIAGTTHFTFKGLSKTGELYQLSASALADQNKPEEWNRIQTIFSSHDLKLLDANGRAWTIVGTGINGNNNSIQATITFSRDGHPPPAPGEPSRLVMKIPTECKDILVPFEFTDLPLP